MNRPVEVYKWVRKQPEESTCGFEREFDYKGTALGIGIESEDTGTHVDIYSTILVETESGLVDSIPVALIRFCDK